MLRPDGEDGTFGVVEMKPGVAVLPLGEDGTVYVVREYRYTIDRDSVGVVAGGIDDGEPAETAARRELRKEVGIEAAEWTDLGAIGQLTETVVSPIQLFLRQLRFIEPAREGSERIRVVRVALEEAVAWVMNGSIAHAASAVLILKVRQHLGQ